jgi:hypothetical protein
MSLEMVKEWLGHSSVQVTEKVYAFLEFEQLREAITQKVPAQNPAQAEGTIGNEAASSAA